MRGGEKLKLGGKKKGREKEIEREREGWAKTTQSTKVHDDTYDEVGRKPISMLFPLGMIIS